MAVVQEKNAQSHSNLSGSPGSELGRLRTTLASLCAELAKQPDPAPWEWIITLSGVDIGPHGKAEICPTKLRPIADILAGSLDSQALEDSQYLSVEAIISRSADMSAQLYALGVLAYRLVTGSHPFKADSLEEMVAVKISFDVPPLSQVRPGLNKEWDALIQRALCRDADARFTSLEQFITQMDRIPIELNPASHEYQAVLVDSSESNSQTKSGAASSVPSENPPKNLNQASLAKPLRTRKLTQELYLEAIQTALRDPSAAPPSRRPRQNTSLNLNPRTIRDGKDELARILETKLHGKTKRGPLNISAKLDSSSGAPRSGKLRHLSLLLIGAATLTIVAFVGSPLRALRSTADLSKTSSAQASPVQPGSEIDKDSVAPPPPTILSPYGGSTIARDELRLYGLAEPHSQVEVFDGNQSIGVVRAGADSVWTFRPTQPLASGAHRMHVIAEDQAGNRSKASRVLSVKLANSTENS